MDRYCSQCGTALVRQLLGGRERPVCPVCGHVIWSHFSLGVGGLLVHQGRVLLTQRNIEPNPGQWVLPGGYVETEETLDQAIVREFNEETGLEVRPTGLLALWQSPESESNSSWCVFGVELTHENQVLNPDPVEVRQARFINISEIASLEGVGLWSRWMVEHYLPQELGLFHQEIEPSIRARLKNPRTTLFAIHPAAAIPNTQ